MAGVPMSGDVLDRRKANALIEGATAAIPSSGTGDPVAAVIERFRANYGGLWVGGNALLTAAEVSFAPNSVNRAVHAGSLDVTVPLERIQRVEVQRGVLTSIVSLHVGQGTVKIRCFRAEAFASGIRAATGRL